MFTISHALPVNDSVQPNLTRHQVWHRLVFKAENAVPFVPGMTTCEVLERDAQSLVRECEYKGERFQEKITFHPETVVNFERLSGSGRGSIKNEIEENENGELFLRFTFCLEVEGIEPDSPEEHAYAKRMEKDYVQAITATLDTIRRLVAEGKL